MADDDQLEFAVLLQQRGNLRERGTRFGFDVSTIGVEIDAIERDASARGNVGGHRRGIHGHKAGRHRLDLDDVQACERLREPERQQRHVDVSRRTPEACRQVTLIVMHWSCDGITSTLHHQTAESRELNPW